MHIHWPEMLWWAENELDSDMFKWTGSQMFSCIWLFYLPLQHVWKSLLTASFFINYIHVSISFLLFNKQEHSICIYIRGNDKVHRKTGAFVFSLSLSLISRHEAGHRKHCGRDWGNKFQSLSSQVDLFSPMKNKTKWIPSKFRGHLSECKLEYLKEEKPMHVSLSVKVENCVPLFSTSQPRPLSFLSSDDETSLLLSYQWHNASLGIFFQRSMMAFAGDDGTFAKQCSFMMSRRQRNIVFCPSVFGCEQETSEERERQAQMGWVILSPGNGGSGPAWAHKERADRLPFLVWPFRLLLSKKLNR